ncbi:hypothetical protein MATL_G00108240 [Megalops atlanticus]|uniref:Cadherin domain-containing protein n=1 Tax=Megalops atlanticus TaxID=7932 RepID=A0A9D3Q1V4_MEGAT|nr:hypothetical protein MATL_G00108240 [Megalops atlanticus]
MTFCTMKSVAVILLLTLNLIMLDATSFSSEKHSRKKRAWIIDSFTIEEEHPGPFPYKLGTIEIERDYRVGFALTGKGVDEEPVGILSINEKTGVIMVHGKVDYEQHNVLRLVFEARNMSNMKVDTKLGVEISILDINDHAPLFQKNVYDISVEESTTQGTKVIMVLAIDGDAPGTPNSTFGYRIASVTPQTPNVEFYIEKNGQISFKGCLDYEATEKYTIVVEAKDHGDVVRLSSTCSVIVNVVDKNNHIPTFVGRTGTGKVKERETGTTVLRLCVDDKDTRNTSAWRAKYTIHGDKNGHFKIVTDPETNDGILMVEKPLDFEEGAERNLSVSVENEDPYFSCELKRKTTTGLWQVVNTGGVSGTGIIPKTPSEMVTIIVEDINDPPIFRHSVKDVMVEENVGFGHPLEQFTAVDLDLSYTNEFEYVKGYDPDNWVTLDSKTGKISTAKVLDRESPYVKNDIYTVTLYAIDKGDPPMTATATLTIRLKDVNDNVPMLNNTTLDMCLSDGSAVIGATDLDEVPYSGPFRFELLGDVKDKWRLDPNFGNTVNLVKENTVYAGHHELLMNIYDTQGQVSQQNLSVTVCDCSDTPNCHVRRSASAQVGGSAVGIMLAALFLLIGILLLAFLISCTRVKPVIEIVQDSGEYLLPSNIEIPGTDCKVPMTLQEVDKGQVKVSQDVTTNGTLQTAHTGYQSLQQSALRGQAILSQSAVPLHQFQRGNSIYRSMPMWSNSRSSHYQESTFNRRHSMSMSMSKGQSVLKRNVLTSLLFQRICTIQAPNKELFDYKPHVYAYEEDFVTDPHLDAISIPESDFVSDELLYLGSRFNRLASICTPNPAPH